MRASFYFSIPFCFFRRANILHNLPMGQRGKGTIFASAVRGWVLWALLLIEECFCFAFWIIVRLSSLSQYPDTLLGGKHLWSETSVVSYWPFPSEWQWNNCASCHSAREMPTLDLCQASDKLHSPNFMGLPLWTAILLQTRIFFFVFCTNVNSVKNSKRIMTSALGMDLRMMPLKCLEFGEADQKNLCVLACLRLFPWPGNLKLQDWKEISGRFLEQRSFCSRIFMFFIV